MFHRRLSILSFRMRSPLRDAETDRSRSDRLSSSVDAIAAEVISEQRGLEERYREACISAGFAADASGSSESADRQDRLADLAATILACERRLSTLARHLELLAAAKSDVRQMHPDTMRPGVYLEHPTLPQVQDAGDQDVDRTAGT